MLRKRHYRNCSHNGQCTRGPRTIYSTAIGEGTTNSFAIAFLWRKLKTYCQALADELNCAKNSAQRARSLSCILHDDALEKRVCDVHALFVALANELPQ